MVTKKKSKKELELEDEVERLIASVRRQSEMSKRSMFYDMEDTALELAYAVEELLEKGRR